LYIEITKQVRTRLELSPDQQFVLVIKKGFRVVSLENLQSNEEKLNLLARLSQEKLLVILLNDRPCHKDLASNLDTVKNQITAEVSDVRIFRANS